jgi:hypothetical protein
MRNTVRIIACLLVIIGVTPAYALDYISQYVPQAEKVGYGRLSVMFWDVYDASLYAPNGKWDENKPFALQLSYLRNIPGKKIADRSVEEIRNQGFYDEVRLADWHGQMIRIFPDVDDSTSLTGIYTQSGETLFLNGSQEIGRIKDPEFGKYFFDIWLGERTSAPNLRQRLLGRS